MPIYDYRCEACDHRLEALQKLSDEPLRECPQCHQLALAKQVTAAAFRLKGGGWYESDFKNNNQKNLAKSDDTGAASTTESKTVAPACQGCAHNQS